MKKKCIASQICKMTINLWCELVEKVNEAYIVILFFFSQAYIVILWLPKKSVNKLKFSNNI